MKPIDQTIFPPPKGNCFAACVASILEISLEEIPNNPNVEGWWKELERWLASRGMSLVFSDVGNHGFDLIGYSIMVSAYHSVVCYNNEIVHDPDPTHRQVVELWKDRVVFAVLDPSKLLNEER